MFVRPHGNRIKGVRKCVASLESLAKHYNCMSRPLAIWLVMIVVLLCSLVNAFNMRSVPSLRATENVISCLCSTIVAFILSVVTQNSFSQFSEPNAIITQTLSWANYVDFADMDNDGDSDIIVLGDSLVVIYNEDGADYFDSNIVNLNASIMSWNSFELIDIDGNGWLDIVGIGDYISINLRNDNDDFQEQIIWPGRDIEFADLDSDGDLDAVVSILFGNLYLYENTGSGVFSSPTLIANISDDARVLIKDLDNDGDLDIVTLNRPPNTTTIKSFQNTGGMSFVQVQSLPVGCTIYRSSLSLFDYDEDGIDDILYSTNCSGSNSIRWMKGFGDATFYWPQVLFPFDDVIHNYNILDYNGDGLNDLFFYSTSGLYLSLGASGAQFEEPIQLISSSITRFLRNDIDGDGDDDYFVLSGNGQLSRYGFDGVSMRCVDILLTRYPEANSWVRFGDLNGDSIPDMVRSSMDGYLLLYRSDVYDGFRDAEILFDMGLYIDGLELSDMNGDGLLDIVLYTDKFYIYINQGDYNFSLQSTHVAAAQLNYDSFVCIDMDSDGDKEILYPAPNSIRLLKNNGGNIFSLQLSLAYNDDGFLVLDYNGDGLLDIVLAGLNGSWRRNLGGLNFSAPITLLWGGGRVAAQDMDEDGDLDLCAMNGINSDASVWWYESNGNGSYSVIHEVDMTGIPIFSDPYLWDIDNDGDIDIVCAGSSGLFIKLNDGNGEFDVASAVQNVGPFLCTPCEAIDMDHDGDADLVHSSPIQGNASGVKLMWVENFMADPFLVQGVVFQDMNGNGYYEEGETPLSGVGVEVEPSGYLTMSSNPGHYEVRCSEGEYNIGVQTLEPWWIQTTLPEEYNVTLSQNTPQISGTDFGFQAAFDTAVVEIEVVMGSAPCSDLTSLWLVATNRGTSAISGTLRIELDGLFAFVSSEPGADVFGEGVIEWDVTGLDVFESMVAQLVIQMPDVSAIGDEFLHVASFIIDGPGGDDELAFNGALQGVIACAYDPNDKLVDPLGYGSLGAVVMGLEYVDYTIRFQNTGNAPAVNVVLRDQLDAFLIPGSLRVLGASHTPSDIFVENDGELVVRFLGIDLPDSSVSFTESQGFIKFRLDVVPGLAHLSQIRNRARIYFDLNAPIITNATLTTIVDCDLWQPEIEEVEIGLLEVTVGDAYQWYLNDTLLQGANNRYMVISGSGYYYALVTSEHGCESATSVFGTPDVGITEPQQMRMVVAPNPVSSVCEVFLERPLEASERLEVVDVHGRIVQTHSARGEAKVVIDAADLVAGVYLVMIKDHSGVRAIVRMVVL